MSSLDRARRAEAQQHAVDATARSTTDGPETAQEPSGATGLDGDQGERQRGRERPGRDWDAGPELTPAQAARQAIAERDAAVRSDMLRDELGAFGPDGRWHRATDWRPI